jgi:hypothetical protein
MILDMTLNIERERKVFQLLEIRLRIVLIFLLLEEILVLKYFPFN